MRRFDPSQFLQKLEPTRNILCLTRLPNGKAGGGSLGFAVSDPYLSAARPLQREQVFSLGDRPLSAALKRIRYEQDIGGVVLGRAISGMPLLPGSEKSGDSEQMQIEVFGIVRSIKEFETLPCTFSEESSNKVEIERELQENLLWDSLELAKEQLHGEGDPATMMHTHSALSLQLWLDEHCGGWQNTFG